MLADVFIRNKDDHLSFSNVHSKFPSGARLIGFMRDLPWRKNTFEPYRKSVRPPVSPNMAIEYMDNFPEIFLTIPPFGIRDFLLPCLMKPEGIPQRKSLRSIGNAPMFTDDFGKSHKMVPQIVT